MPDEEYFKDRNCLREDQLEEERKLWQFIEDNNLLTLEQKPKELEKRTYLCNSSELV